ncbi:type II toxin-antitoxin system HicB family antitoxin [Methylocella sp.]|uniref:type II toxin-antitoxin system HicB family antitoxin n=1 Tax=Methylocella sp. TaxID=1978226 RepID=UPI0035AF15D2
MLLNYKGYSSNVKFETDDQAWVGRLDGITDIIGFHAEKLEDLEVAFREAVDDYLEYCGTTGKEPNRPKNAEP